MKSQPFSTAGSRYYPIWIISLCGCFLFYKYVLQVYPSVITESLMSEFHLTGAGLGSLVATFYYALTFTQLVVGVMLDKYSARWITGSAIFACALGVVLFAEAHSVIGAGLARALMGAGVAFATVAYMKLASIWFPPRQYAFVAGLLATAAMAGAVFGKAPLSFLIDAWGWRPCLWMIGIAGFVLAILFVLTVRDAPVVSLKSKAAGASQVSLSDVLQVLKSKQNWLLTLYGGLAFSPVAVFGGLWGDPFIQQAYHLDKTQSASMVSLVFIGFGLGSPIIGYISNYFGSRRNLMFYCTLFAAAEILVILYSPSLSLWVLGVLLFGFGFALGSFVLVFTVGKELNKLSLTATVVAMINASDAILDAIAEPAIGRLLDVGWDGKMVNGVHYFSLASYHMALSVLPICLVSAALLLLWVQDRISSSEILG